MNKTAISQKCQFLIRNKTKQNMLLQRRHNLAAESPSPTADGQHCSQVRKCSKFMLKINSQR